MCVLVKWPNCVVESKKKVTDATNRFFEARVAVMGFKCKVIQLQGEMEQQQRQQQQQQHKQQPDSVSICVWVGVAE